MIKVFILNRENGQNLEDLVNKDGWSISTVSPMGVCMKGHYEGSIVAAVVILEK